MNTEDEYVVYIDKNNFRFYMKNGQFHRENGPAIFRFEDNKELLKQYNDVDLTNNGLYKEVYDLTTLDFVPLIMEEGEVISSYNRSIASYIIKKESNIIVTCYNKPVHLFGGFEPYFMLNDKMYEKSQYDTIMRNKNWYEKLNKNLTNLKTKNKKLKKVKI